MPRPLPEVPAGTALLLDSNIFIYAFCGESEQCARLIERCRNEELLGVTTGEVIGEVCHRLMIREALESGAIPRPIVAAFKVKPDTVAGLRTYWDLTVGIFRSNLLLIGSVEERHLRA